MMRQSLQHIKKVKNIAQLGGKDYIVQYLQNIIL